MRYRGFIITSTSDSGIERYDRESSQDVLCDGYYCQIYDGDDDQYANQLDDFCIAEGHEIKDCSYGELERGIARYVDDHYHNAVFVGKNPEGVAVHAHKRGTGSESTFKGNVDSSDPRYSFHWIGRSNRVYLFEAPIDMLSFISLHRNGWQNHSYAAACGVSDQVMWQMLADHPQIDTVYLCHDSDVDGQKAAVRIANKLTEQGINTEILVPIRKDWNEDLLYPPDETEEEICIQTM